MIKKLFSTQSDSMLFFLRVVVGLVMFPHGAQKLLGWFDGYGYEGTTGFFIGTLGIPRIFAICAIVAESFGSLGLIAGIGTRIAAFGVTMNMIVAVMMINVKNGFFMNWQGMQRGEGFEFHALIIAAGISLMIDGGGSWSVDKIVAGKIKNKQ